MFGLIIWITSYLFDDPIFLTLFVLPVSLTSFLYANRLNVIPALVSTSIYVTSFYGLFGGFADLIVISLTTPILFIISILIGYTGYEVLKMVNTERRKNFLDTILRQDLRSNAQLTLGYLELLEEADLSKEYQEYFEKALRSSEEEIEVLEIAKKLRDMEKKGSLTEKDVAEAIDKAIEGLSDSDICDDVKIVKEYEDDISKVKGDYSLKLLFDQILKTRIKDADCDELKIDAEESKHELFIKIRDDGKRYYDELKDLLSKDDYKGMTTGFGGVRYYVIGQIAEHNKADIDLSRSEMGGARFVVKLKKC